ncbi:hypothetical protein ACIOG4_28030 [Streptomyces microflavus]|uniref:hypothetical protein n=1 Tax=Streptomyces microflavus TaxID=1919 RepID=UPI003830E5D1
MPGTDEPIDLNKREEPLNLSEISRALGLQSRGTAQKWHKPPKQAIMNGRGPANKPALHAVAEAIGVELSQDTLESSKPLFPPEVVLALGKALGYLDSRGKIVEALRDKGRGRWFPVDPTTDPATGDPRVYANHLSTLIDVKPATIEMGLLRGTFKEPDGLDEMGRNFWWVPTANQILKKYSAPERFTSTGGIRIPAKRSEKSSP